MIQVNGKWLAIEPVSSSSSSPSASTAASTPSNEPQTLSAAPSSSTSSGDLASMPWYQRLSAHAHFIYSINAVARHEEPLKCGVTEGFRVLPLAPTPAATSTATPSSTPPASSAS